AQLSIAVENVRTWRPVDGPLIDRMREAFDVARSRVTGAFRAGRKRPDSHEEILSAVPDRFRDQAVSLIADPTAGVPPADMQRRFLAAHAFANWTAYLGEDLRTWLRSIEAAAALIESGVGVRNADLLLRHLVDPHALARALTLRP